MVSPYSERRLPPDWLEQLQASYPRRDGPQWWVRVRTLLPQCVSAGATWEEILAGTKAYADYCRRQQLTGTSYIKPASNFFDYRTQGWTEDYSAPPIEKTPRERAEVARWEGLRARQAAIGFRPPTIHDTADSYETAVRLAERELETDRRALGSHRAPELNNVITMLARAKTA